MPAPVPLDPAHCERRAATNALSLPVRPAHNPGVALRLTALGEKGLAPFRRVFAECNRRGLSLGTPPPDDYASELRKLTRASAGDKRDPTSALIDRLLVAALIGARSCERFRLLSRALDERGPADLASLYGELLAAEARHFATFVEMAREIAAPAEARVDVRLEELASLEGQLAARLPSMPAVH